MHFYSNLGHSLALNKTRRMVLGIVRLEKPFYRALIFIRTIYRIVAT